MSITPEKIIADKLEDWMELPYETPLAAKEIIDALRAAGFIVTKLRHIN